MDWAGWAFGSAAQWSRVLWWAEFKLADFELSGYRVEDKEDCRTDAAKGDRPP